MFAGKLHSDSTTIVSVETLKRLHHTLQLCGLLINIEYFVIDKLLLKLAPFLLITALHIMTSEPGVKHGWTCGFNAIIEELGRIASLEYPIFPQPQEPFPGSVVTKSPSTASTSSQSESPTMPVPRISLPRPTALKPKLPRIPPRVFRPFSTSGPPLRAWTGRGPDEHVNDRADEKDVQSQEAQQGKREKASGDSHSQAITEKGGEPNKKAEQENPEAPKPVIGMNDERGH